MVVPCCAGRLFVCISIGLMSAIASGMQITDSEQDDQGSVACQLGLGQDEPWPRTILFDSSQEPSLFISWLVQSGYINEETLLGPEGQTFAHFALIFAQNPTQVLEWLHAKGYSLHEPDKRGRLPIHYAAYYNLRNVMIALVSHTTDDGRVLVNVRDNEGRSPLFYAAQEGAQKAIVYLMDHHRENLDFTLKDSQGASVWHYSMLSCNEQAVFSLWTFYYELSLDKPDLSQDNEGRRPIHYAALGGFEDFFEALEDDQEREHYPGVDIHVLDNHGNGIFHYAAQSSYGSGVLEAGIGDNNDDLFLLNNAGQSPAYIALERGWNGVAHELFAQELCAGNWKDIEHLLALGVNISRLQTTADNTKISLLEMNRGNPERVKVLLSWGIEWEHREELTELLRQAFSDLEAQYSSLSNALVPTWELPLMCLPCFYEAFKADLYLHVLRLRGCFESQDEDVRKYVANLVNQTLLIAMAYGRLEVVEEIISHVRSSCGENVRYYINNATWIQLFLRSALSSRRALAVLFNYVSSIVTFDELKVLFKRALLLVFSQRQIDNISFLLEHGVSIPERIYLTDRILAMHPVTALVQGEDKEKEKEASIPDDYTRMLALLRDYYPSYRTLLLSNQRLAHVNRTLSLPAEILALIMYWFMNGYLYNHSVKNF